MATKSTELTTVQPPELGGIQNLIEMGMTADDIILPRTTVPSGGSLQWEVPGDDPDNPEYVKDLQGVVIDQYAYDSFYTQSFDENPDAEAQAIWIAGKQIICTEEAVKAGILKGEGVAAQPLNAFGTAKKGKGKAIQNKWRLFLAREGETFPLRVDLSIMSRGPWTRFNLNTLGKYPPFSKVVSLKLTAARSSGDIRYAKLVTGIAGDVPEEHREEYAKYAEQMKPLTSFHLGETAQPVVEAGDSDGVAAAKEMLDAEDAPSDSIPF